VGGVGVAAFRSEAGVAGTPKRPEPAVAIAPPPAVGAVEAVAVALGAVADVVVP
jgi:hypothetical protein